MNKSDLDRAARRVRIGARGLVLAAIFLCLDASLKPAHHGDAAPLTLHSPLLQTRTEVLLALDRYARVVNELGRIELAEIIADVGYRHGVDPMLLLAVMAVESEFHRGARSRVGAMGFMQLMRVTAFEFSHKLQRPMHELGLLDARTNIELGAAYLRFLHERMGSWPMALAAYNWGPTKVVNAVRANHHRLPQVMRIYERRVNKQYHRMVQAAGIQRSAQLGPSATGSAI